MRTYLKILFSLFFLNVSYSQKFIDDLNVKKMPISDKEITNEIDWFKRNNNWNGNTNFIESYSVASKDFNTFIVKINENLKINNEEIKSYFVIAKPSNYKSELSMKYIHRETTNSKGTKIEIINIDTGNIVDYHLIGISESDYLNSLDSSTVQGGSLICFKSFSSCIKKMNESLEDPFNAMTCDWLPCNTMFYLACKFSQIEGWMQDSDNFVGNNRCKTIY